LNVKEEGLETPILGLIREHDIKDFFFLDQSFPFLIKTAKKGEHRCAVRVSEYESIDTALTLAGKIDWVWVDYFSRFPLTREHVEMLHSAGFKLCLVSPELQGFEPKKHIPELQKKLKNEDILVDAVCTKEYNLWI
jgi:hypothetical protein